MGTTKTGSTLGHRAPVDHVVREYERLVAAAVRRVLGPSVDIDDVVQETWIVYLCAGHQVRESSTLGGWLFRVATRLAVRSQRRVSQAVPIAGVGEMIACPPCTDVESEILWALRRSVVEQAVGSLGERERDIVELLMSPDEIGYREISDRLGVPIGSVGPTRDRLIRKLQSLPAVQRLSGETETGAVRPMGRAS